MMKPVVIVIALLLAAAAVYSVYKAAGKRCARKRLRKMFEGDGSVDEEAAVVQQLEINKEKYAANREHHPEHASAILHHNLVAQKAFGDMRRADEAIKREFWKSGGLRFYAERLLQQIKDTAPDAEAEAMRVDLYFSLVEPVRERLAVLRAVVEESEESKRSMQCAEEKLRELGEDHVLEQDGYLELVYVPRQTELYEQLNAVYESREALLLGPVPEGEESPDAADMYAAAERLASMVQNLLNDYSIPV